MSASASRLIEVRNLVKQFPGRGQGRAVRAVDDVSFEVMSGETLGVIGETGAGKTTLARLIGRLLDPSSGEIRLGGRDLGAVTGAELRQLRTEVQMLFGDPYASLNPHRTAGAIIGEAFEIHPSALTGADQRRRVQDLMRRVGLDRGHHDRYPHEFSAGERQRIGIARAIALGPKVLIADEPVASLDLSIQAQVLSLLRGLQRELGLTLIFITRDLAVARHMCDRVAVMYLGKIVELAPADALYGFPRHPYTGALISAVPALRSPGDDGKRELLTGEVPSAADAPSACRFHTRCPKAQYECSQREPPPADKGGGTVAACHYPLTREEADGRLSPAGAA
ncbi:MAG TPA: oligopeptide/dipeptide ABC transporter ATP-binding protein [Solirubrobacteraceae bacterium]|nr:oligopeptide/dipeptide ABC transporter ATP-binding protein [Solirubrobacteraceae bacterium]